MKNTFDDKQSAIINNSLDKAWQHLDDAYNDMIKYAEDNGVDPKDEEHVAFRNMITLIQRSRKDAMRAMYWLDMQACRDEEL